MNNRNIWFKRALFAFVIVFFVIIVIITLRLPQIPSDLNLIASSNPTLIYADDKQLIRSMTDRQLVPLEQIPQDFIHAIVSLEDDNFYTHRGINKKGFVRALLVNIKAGRIKEGGSSITQQLAKNLFFSFDRTWSRKIKELLVTLQLEQQFSKDQIIEAYINQIDFGSQVNGLEMAAQTYFSRHADELNLAQCAMLAGIPNSPNLNNPYKNEERARERMALVLRRMEKEKYISAEQKQAALDEPLDFKRINKYFGQSDYFVEEIIKQLSENYGREAVVYGGLSIYTTINLKLQFAAKKAVENGLKKLDELMGLPAYSEAGWDDKLNYPQAAIIVLDPQSGSVKAMMGGRDFQRAPFNRAVSNNRQAGSLFKLFTYIAAIDKGLATPKTVLVDEPISLPFYPKPWEPKNFDMEYQGPMTLKWAFANSRNVIAAKLIDRVTPKVVINYAEKLGITSPMQEHLSLALGATSVSLLEMASAYSTIANEGIRRDPYMVVKINLKDNSNFFEHEIKSKRVIDQQTSFIMIDMMKGVVDYGTGKSIRESGITRPCAGKTGTTNDFRDAWFIGYTPDIVIAVWVGFDDNRSMHTKWHSGVTGAMSAVPVWIEFMKMAMENISYSNFTTPPGIVYEEIDPITGSGPMPGNTRIIVALREGMDEK